MPKYYSALDNDGTYGDFQASPPASGPIKILVYKGPTLGNQWDYSGAVNGTTTFYVVTNSPSVGRELSAT